MNGPGRPTKLTDETVTKLINHIRMGLPIFQACQLAGISQSTYYNWKNRAESGEAEYVEFLESIKRAEVEAQVKLIQDVQRDESWQSSAWMLERRWSHIYGRKDYHKHSGGDKAIEHKVDLSDEALNAIEAAILDREDNK